MRTLKVSSVNIPKSGAKLHDLDGFTIFIRRLKKMTFVYETTTAVQLMCVVSDQWDDDRILRYVNSRKPEVEDFMQLEFIINEDNELVLPSQG